MIQCPECGEQAPDGAKFCDRCGRSLQQPLAAAGGPVTRPLALEPGTTLDHGFEIVALLAQTSIENRYRARRTGNGSRETVILRERRADGQSDEPADAVAEPVVEPRPAPPAEDPNGPRAKTAELKRLPAMEAAPAESSELAEAAAEPAAAIEEPAAVSSNGTAPPADDAIAETRQSEATYSDEPATGEPLETTAAEDLGEVFGRVLALSQTLNHPAFQRAAAGFAEGGRVYLAYPDEELVSVTGGASRLAEPEAISAAIQVCQAISYAHRRGLRVNDICPQSVGRGTDGRIKLAGLEYVSNDNERQAEPIFNDGYTAPEIYRGRKVDKRADIFSVGALLYTWLTGERIEVESWREEAGPVTFYPPHVVSPELEQAVRRALLFDPAARWANIDELKTALIRLLAEVAVEASVLTDVGMVREHNEDSVMALEYTRDSLVEPARSFLYAVCDGMGGAEAGEVASAIAVKAIRDYVEGHLVSGADAGTLMTAALEEANSKIIEYQSAHPESRGMGSTGVIALVTPRASAVGWCGDSRAYLLAGGGNLRQITRDHSLVQRLIEIGQITPEEARKHEHKNVITRSLGARQSGPAGAEAVPLTLKRGDRLLLCSDGLTAHVEDREIGEILRRHHSPRAAARELIAAANAGGGTDNISVAVVYAS